MPRRVPTAVPQVSVDAITAGVWAYVSRRLTSLAVPTDIVKFVGKGTGTELPDNKSLYDLIALDRLDNATYGLSALRARILERLTKADFDTKLPDARAALIDEITAVLTKADFDTKLPDARAALIDLITKERMSELDAGNIPADVDALILSLAAVLALQGGELSYASDESQVTLNTTGSDQSLGAKNLTVSLPAGCSVVKAIAVAVIIASNRTATAQDIDFNLKVAGTPVFSQDDVISFDAVKGSIPLTIAQDCTAQVTGDGTYALEAEAQLGAAQNTTFTTVYLLFVQYRKS